MIPRALRSVADLLWKIFTDEKDSFSPVGVVSLRLGAALDRLADRLTSERALRD